MLIPAKAEFKICTFGADAYAFGMRHPAGDNLFDTLYVLFDVLFFLRCQCHFLGLVQQGIIHDALRLNSSFPEVVKIIEHLAQVGFFHLFCLFYFMKLHDSIALFHEIDADCIVDGDVLFAPAVSLFMQQFADVDVFVLMFESDVVGEEPELGVADVVVVDLDTGYFHVGSERVV